MKSRIVDSFLRLNCTKAGSRERELKELMVTPQAVPSSFLVVMTVMPVANREKARLNDAESIIQYR